ncbi:MAG: hypothetical protein U9Q07_07460, partial [Planctomycetota bacterium]|nr:hypothetical protein [Planctomycetota bacterium]
ALVLISIFLILLGCLLPAGFYTGFPIASRIVAQLSVIMEELPLAVSGYEFDYARLSSKYGMSDFSGIWRISHWRTSFDIVAKANTFQLLFGHGIGSANLLLYKLPHNDYLRVLIEQGIVGLTLTAAFFLTLFRRINWKYWHCIVVVGLYCISENNMDNLLFMCIFAFFLASAQNKPLPDPTASIA